MRTRHGMQQYDARYPLERNFEKALIESGQTATVQKKPYEIQVGGVGGFAKSIYRCTFPVGICGNNGEFESLEIDQDILMLLSRKYQASLDVHHHIRAQTIDIGIFDLADIKVLETIPGRHPGLSLLNFDGIHPGVAGNEEPSAFAADEEPHSEEDHENDVAHRTF